MKNKAIRSVALEHAGTTIDKMLIDMHYVAPEMAADWLKDKVTAIVKKAIAETAEGCPSGEKFRDFDVLLARIGDDIHDKTCPLADQWWFDDDTTMAQRIREVCE